MQPVEAIVKELFGRAAELPVKEREAFLQREAAGDIAVIARVKELLDAATAASMALPAPVVAGADWPPQTLTLPTSIGSYRATHVLGRGGMGVVYEAEQAKPARKVALKVIRRDVCSPRMVARFERESELLGRLVHPGIGAIYEAGSAETEHGPQSFFAMELVDGIPLTEFADKAHLSTSQRLELMIRVCDAVEHAHRHGVIHLDLKPGNILVTPAGQPKVLDFGIARASDLASASATLRTTTREIVGTLPYMSPEQVNDPRGVDTRADVYALGVVLFELLVGRVPFDLRSCTLHEAFRIISEQPPPSIAASNPSFHGDLATIVACALDKDKSRRYGSAAALGDDLRRFLKHEPIAARRPTVSYTFSKWVARNRVAAGLGFVAMAGILTGALLALAYGVSEAKQRTIAESSLQTARNERDLSAAVTDYLVKDVFQADGTEGSSSRLRLIDILEPASLKVHQRLVRRPYIELRVRGALGHAWLAAGSPQRARREFEEAINLQGTAPEAHPEEIEDLELGKGEALWRQERADLAEPLIRDVVAARQARLGDHDDATLDAMEQLAGALKHAKRLDEADVVFRSVETAYAALQPAKRPDLLRTQYNRALVEVARGRVAPRGSDAARNCYEHALPLMAAAVSESQSQLHPSDGSPATVDADVAIREAELAKLYISLGRNTEALPAAVTSLKRLDALLGHEHWRTIEMRANLAYLYLQTQQFQEAAAILPTALDQYRRVRGVTFGETIGVTQMLAQALAKTGRCDDSEPVLRQAYENLRDGIAEEPADTARAKKLALFAAEYFASNGISARSEEWQKLAEETPRDSN